MNFIRKSSKNKLPRAFLFFLIFTCSANVAMATTYECNTEQATVWKEGHLLPRNSQNYGPIHAVIYFNDETGDMWTAIDKDSDSPLDPLPFKILKPMASGEELLAILDDPDDVRSAGNVFRLRGWDKKTGIVFFLNSTSTDSISAGKCHVSNKATPKINRI